MLIPLNNFNIYIFLFNLLTITTVQTKKKAHMKFSTVQYGQTLNIIKNIIKQAYLSTLA